VAGGEIADVHRHPGECLHLHGLPLGQEAVGDTTLIEHFDGARVQTSRARAFEPDAGASLDDENVGPRQRQLRRQHHPRRTAAGDHHRMLGHTPPLLFPRVLVRPVILEHAPGLAASARSADILRWEEWSTRGWTFHKPDRVIGDALAKRLRAPIRGC
jgi:hypothetical protein